MSQLDPEIKALQDAIFLSKVRRARETPMSRKIADGPLLFDQSLQTMRCSIRSENPGYTQEQVEQEVGRRLRIARLISDGDRYRDAGEVDE